MAAKASNEKREEEIKNALEAFPGFKPSLKFIGSQNEFFLAIDNQAQKILFLKEDFKLLFSYEDIISVEILDNDCVVSKKSITRTVGGTLVGGILAGGAGAIVGGLSGDSTQNNLHYSLNVKILLRNNSIPSILIPCFDCKRLGGQPLTSDEYFYQVGLAKANRINDILCVIIDAENKNYSATPQIQFNGSIADELGKLAELKEKGYLTDEEFNQQKANLIHGANAPITPSKIEISFENPFDNEIRELLKNNKSEALELAKTKLSCSLFEAKEYIDSLC